MGFLNKQIKLELGGKDRKNIENNNGFAWIRKNYMD